MDSDDLARELKTEKTSCLIFWIAHPSGLLSDLKDGRIDSVKPSEALERFLSIADAIGNEIDRRFPAPEAA